MYKLTDEDILLVSGAKHTPDVGNIIINIAVGFFGGAISGAIGGPAGMIAGAFGGATVAAVGTMSSDAYLMSQDNHG
jgi:hypothetical protein